MCSDSRAHTRGLVTARNSGVGLAVRTHMDCVRCVCRTARYLRSDDHCTANASQRRLMIHQMDDLLTACNSNCNSLLRSKLELSNQHACPCLEHSKLSYLLTSEAFIYRNLFNLENLTKLLLNLLFFRLSSAHIKIAFQNFLTLLIEKQAL